MFQLRDWDDLSTLPIYDDEVPLNSLVTVGFTLAGPWNYDPPIPTGHFYLAFIVLLAVPKER